MKYALALVTALATAVPLAAVAAPPGGICLDPHYSYQATVLGRHEIVAKSTFGHDHRELLLETTCIGLSSVFHIALQSDFICLDKGDSVFTSTIDGERQHCRITSVQPYTGAPAHTPS